MKRTAVILEGADCTGKGTVAEMFKAIGFDYYHFGPPKGDDDPSDHYTLECFRHYTAHCGPTVFDRSHLGEQVYGPIYRKRDTLGLFGRHLLEKYLETRGAIVILMTPNKFTAGELWEARAKAGGEMFVDGWEKQYDAFMRLRTTLPTLRYDWTRESIESLMERYWMALRYWHGRRTT